jgi:hypothetical protein
VSAPGMGARVGRSRPGRSACAGAPILRRLRRWDRAVSRPLAPPVSHPSPPPPGGFARR